MSDKPEATEAVERWRQGKINIFDEMARLERERDEARAECLEQSRLLGMSAEREEKLRSKILMQAKVFRGEDLRDNSRWSIFNEGRAQALEKLADETWP